MIYVKLTRDDGSQLTVLTDKPLEELRAMYVSAVEVPSPPLEPAEIWAAATRTISAILDVYQQTNLALAANTGDIAIFTEWRDLVLAAAKAAAEGDHILPAFPEPSAAVLALYSKY